MEQTALEWFINGLLVSNYITKDSKIMNQFIKKAKKMEKEQIKDAFSFGRETPLNHPDLPHYSSEEYFNDIYNK